MLHVDISELPFLLKFHKKRPINLPLLETYYIITKYFRLYYRKVKLKLTNSSVFLLTLYFIELQFGTVDGVGFRRSRVFPRFLFT